MPLLSLKRWSGLATIVFMLCTALVGVSAQQPSAASSSVADLLKQLSSDEPVVRNEALQELRSNPQALQDVKIKTTLINLLNRENHIKVSPDDEGYAEYVSWLAETTAKVVDWSDQRQVCILTDGLILDDELADHARASLPCLLRRFKSAPHLVRGSVAAMMIQALAKGRNELDPPMIQSTQETILGALHDSDQLVRAETVRALGRFGGPEMIPALDEVAKTDKAIDKLGNRLWIREYAVKAIDQIQKRTQVHN